MEATNTKPIEPAHLQREWARLRREQLSRPDVQEMLDRLALKRASREAGR